MKKERQERQLFLDNDVFSVGPPSFDYRRGVPELSRNALRVARIFGRDFLLVDQKEKFTRYFPSEYRLNLWLSNCFPSLEEEEDTEDIRRRSEILMRNHKTELRRFLYRL